MNCLRDDFQSLLKFLVVYQSTKTKRVASRVESYKNISVDLLMHKRGRFQKHILHTSMVGLASIGFLSSGVIGGNSIVASTFPINQGTDVKTIQTFDPSSQGVTLGSFVKLETDVSDKMRSETIDYQVKGGETLSQIAQKFGISVDTIKWANNLDSVDDIKPGQDLKILPVSGVSYTVKKGDTLQDIAKKYSVDAQSIVDFPFNDISDDLQVTSGEVLILPDGTPPEAKATPKPQIQSSNYSSKGSSRSYSAPAGGSFIWPTTYVYISTYFSWWHPGIDLPNPAAPPIHAAAAGTVTYAGWDNTGYGNLVVIDHGNGYTTRYAHQSHILVTVGQHVSQGQVIGIMGSTGRSTGTHLHFEIRYNGVAINPLSILK